MSNRLAQVAGHLSNNYPKGLLKDEVVIVTGELRALELELEFPDLANSGVLEGAAQVGIKYSKAN